jgi:hypothetical protein
MTAALSLSVVDWNRTRRADLSEVPTYTTVAELLSAVKDALNLPRETLYHLLWGGEKLNRSATLDETGLEDGAEVTVAPEVSAG